MHHGSSLALLIVTAALVFAYCQTVVGARTGRTSARSDRFQRAMGWGRWNNAWGAVDERDELAADRRVQLLTTENERLHGKVGRLEDRIAVLERIVTDPAHQLEREIEQLRARAN